MNRIILSGNLGADPETQFLKSGKALTKFPLGVSSGYGENKRTEWFRITCWEKLAETVQKFCLKGKKVLVEGEVKQDKFTGKDGVERRSFEVIAKNIEFLSSASDDGGGRPSIPQHQSQQQGEEIPF